MSAQGGVWKTAGMSGALVGLDFEAAFARIDPRAGLDRITVYELFAWLETGAMRGYAKMTDKDHPENEA